MMDLDSFIAQNVVRRKQSMFSGDIEKNKAELERKIKEKSVLVIGGAGRIGSAYVKEILKYNPRSMTIVDLNENGLAEITRDLRSDGSITVPGEYKTYPMNYHSEVFEKMFKSNGGFDIVANFSAHKHVRSEKDIYSVECLLKNNIIYLKDFLDLLTCYPPSLYFCVSTDKAANPANIMGASKKVMEDLVFSYSDSFPVKTARFANVAFSNGSLPDGFIHRINKLQPLSAPRDVKRYFVSPMESGQICMLASILGNNREIFFPKLQESQMMRFDEIARELLQSMGYEVLECESDEMAIEEAHKLREGSNRYPVHFSASDTSGEKPFEEFFTNEETIDTERFEALGVITSKGKPDREEMLDYLKRMENLLNTDNCQKEDIVDLLREHIPEFSHVETGKSLDMKM